MTTYTSAQLWCGRTFTNFLKDQNPGLYNEYVMERYRDGLTGKGSNTPEPKFDFESPRFKKRKIK